MSSGLSTPDWKQNRRNRGKIGQRSLYVLHSRMHGYPPLVSGVSQFSTGVSYVFGTTISDAAMAVFFIGIVLILAVGTACTGLQKGITPASHVNMYIFIALMVLAFIFGSPLFILNNTTSSIGQYLAFLVPQSFYLEPVKQTGWVANFYPSFIGHGGWQQLPVWDCS